MIKHPARTARTGVTKKSRNAISGWTLLLPIKFAELLRRRPNAVQSAAGEYLTVLDYELDRFGVPDVFERILIKDYQVRYLARLDGAEIPVESHRRGALQRRRAQHLERLHAAGRQHPQLPVRADALLFT